MITDIGIYKIVNIINKKVYVGSSANLKIREYNHFKSLENNRHDNYHLQNAYNKYGKDNFKWEILEYIEEVESMEQLREILLRREQYYINELDVCSRDKGYNIRLEADSNLGLKYSDEHRNNISKSLKNKPKSGSHKLRLKEVRQNMSEVTREKIRKGHLGKKASLETKLKMSNTHSLKKLSENHKNKLSDSHCKNNKWFKGTSSEGIEYLSNNQSKFAKEHLLSASHINRCLKGTRKTHKGWVFCYHNLDN